jgi:hypothetical protein
MRLCTGTSSKAQCARKVAAIDEKTSPHRRAKFLAEGKGKSPARQIAPHISSRRSAVRASALGGKGLTFPLRPVARAHARTRARGAAAAPLASGGCAARPPADRAPWRRRRTRSSPLRAAMAVFRQQHRLMRSSARSISRERCVACVGRARGRRSRREKGRQARAFLAADPAQKQLPTYSNGYQQCSGITFVGWSAGERMPNQFVIGGAPTRRGGPAYTISLKRARPMHRYDALSNALIQEFYSSLQLFSSIHEQNPHMVVIHSIPPLAPSATQPSARSGPSALSAPLHSAAARRRR